MASLQAAYKETLLPVLGEQLGLGNALALPRIEKVVVNVGVGRFVKDAKVVQDIERDLARITGQKPVWTRARKAIAGFKVRQGQEVGLKVTLRGRRMWDFLERLVRIALPRTRDFRGIPEGSFDAAGNLSIGIREHIIFPEAAGDDVKTIFGFQVVLTIQARKREDSIALLRLLGFPLRSSS